LTINHGGKNFDRVVIFRPYNIYGLDIIKLKKLGFNPKITFKGGLKITSKWYDENSHKMRKIQNLNP